MRLLAGPGRTDLVAVSLHRVLRRMQRPCICMLGGPLAAVNSLIACNLATRGNYSYDSTQSPVTRGYPVFIAVHYVATRGHPLPGHPRPGTPFRPPAAIPFPATRGREPFSGHSRPTTSRPLAAKLLTVTRGQLLAYRMGVPLAASCLKLARTPAICGRGFLRTLAVSRTLQRVGGSTLAAVVVAAWPVAARAGGNYVLEASARR